ncbi:MAG: hypothetical protein LC645_04360 [Geobacteraceae bacterium]|nr:hypothetical protein [Geobacteraceae bacterium]
MLKRVGALALVTCKEGIRDRSLFGILLFALFVLGLNVAVAGFFMRDLGKVTVDMNLAALSFAGLLLPFSRGEYIYGKYLGLVLLVVCTLALLLVFSTTTVAGVNAMYPKYFGGFTWSVYFWAVAFIGVQLALLCAIVVFFSAITTSSFITLIFSVATYLVGVSIEEVLFYLKSQAAAGEVAASETLRAVLEVVAWLVPNFAAFDLKTEAAHGLALEPMRLLTSAGYGLGYVLILLWLATLIFRRREFN